MTGRMVRRLGAAGFILGMSASAASADVEVVASIKPIHSLVAAVMAGVGEPALVVSGGGSPHAYALKPSDARALERADVVFWVGEGMEVFLRGAIEGLSGDARVVALAEAPGIELLETREGGVWAAHHHDEDAHEEAGHAAGHEEDHEAEAAGHATGHEHEGAAGHEHEEEPAAHDREAEGHEEGGHVHGAHNLHVWLDPVNAQAMVETIVATLSEADPANRARYEANGERLAGDLGALETEMDERLAPVRGKPFIVFHDAYQYLEHRFGLTAAGSITLSPEVQPGAARLSELRDLIGARGAACVFSEPQFEPKLVALLTGGTAVRGGVLDPLGADLEEGPGLYFDLMRRNAEALVSCLSGSS